MTRNRNNRIFAARALMTLFFFLLAVATFAVPAKPGLTRLLPLSDGTTVMATLVGDEHGHFWQGVNGKSYQLVAGTDTFREVNGQDIMQRAQQRRAQANQQRMRRLAPQRIGNVGTITGDKKGIIILVNFKDVSFTASQEDFNKLANQVNYNSGNYKGSMYDYFYAQSDGQFRLSFDVVGPYTVSQNCSYYGGNDSSGNDLRPGTMVKEALQLANADVNFSNYDWNEDGYVDQVYVVYAGKGEADGGGANTIWPHAWDLTNATGSYITLDGVIINTYACGGELNGQTGATAGIGTMCHEFSHCLGYPDFYDTDYSGGQGMGDWDLMCSGSYNGDGYQPSGYTSYERWVAGWKTPIELVNTQTISNMAALQTKGSNSYIIYNKGNNNEYYLLENRQQTGWDASLPGAGLLILHVDYSSSAWSNNTPNDDPDHQRMTWIPADNEYQYITYQGSKYYTETGEKNDPFPYGSVNAFGKNTTPAATLYNKNSDNTYYLDSSVEDITQNSDSTISFNFIGISNVATPTFSPAAGKYSEAQTVSISCETSGATIYYSLDGTTPTTSSSVYSSPLTISETTTVKAIAVKDGDQSAVATAKYTIGGSTSDPNTKTFKLVSSTDNLEPGMRYIIACGSRNAAAGAYSSSYLEKVDVTVSSDIITIGSGVAVFVLEQTGNNWTFKNESTSKYLQCTGAKNVSYSDTPVAWALSDGTSGVIMNYGEFGTMLYNVSSPRFTTYTSNPTTSMIQANLYMEYSEGGTTITTPELVVDPESLSFEAEANGTQVKTFDILGADLTGNVIVTLTDANNVFSVSPSTISKADAEEGATVSVTFTPTAAGNYIGTVTLSSAGAEPVEVALSATATASTTPDVPSNEFTLVTSASDFVEGDYIIVYNGGAMNTTVSNNRLQYTAVTPTNNVITTTDATIIWHIAPSGNYYTIYNEDEGKYAAGTGTKNQAKLSDDGTNDKSLWSVTTGMTFDFTNKYNAANSVNATLRYNTGYGFACYSTQTGGALSLYKRTSGTTTVAAPTITGTTPFDNSTTVTITAETDASIYYTLDGSTPTSSSTLYSIPFTLNATTTVKAVAIKDNVSSSVTTKEFVRNTAYYEPADGKKGEALKTAMCGIIYNRTEKSYDYLWTAFQTTDVRSDGKVWDMYSNATNFVFGTDQAGQYSKEGDKYNREHSWPKSWFGGEVMPMYTDLHHMYPTDGFVNNKRANYPFGETNGTGQGSYQSNGGFSKLGTCTYPGYTGIVFEPADEYKGDFARTYFYMVTCYEEKLHDWYTNYSSTDVVNVIDGSTYPAFQTWQLNMLMEWAKNDPVSEKEIARNNAVYAIQKNRNPFIDYPGLQEYIWGICTNDAFSYDNYVEPVYATAPFLTVPQTSYAVTVGDPDVNFTVTVTGTPDPTVTATCTEGAYFVFENNEFWFEPDAVGTYHFVFTATNSEGSDSKTVTIVVSPAPVPELTVSDVTSNSAVASWTACDGVTSYTLQLASDNLFSNGGSGSQVTFFSNDANDPSSTPDGWIYNIANTTGSYLQLTASSHYVISEAVDASNCSSLKLSYKQRTYGGTSGNSDVVLVQYSTNNGTSWTDLGTTTAGNTTLTTKSLDVSDVAGMSSVRFRLSVPEATSSKGCGISTIKLTGVEAGNEGSIISTQTVNGTSYTFTGLMPYTVYYARVKGNSDWSNIEEFITETPEEITLADDADNSTTISDNNGKLVNVTLSGRTLYKDGGWNTLCLPFGMTTTQVMTQLAPTKLMELDTEGTYDTDKKTGLAADGTLYLYFKDATSISAGVPYLIKWTGNGTNNIVDPTFTGVTISNASLEAKAAEFTGGKFIGSYIYQSFTTENKYILLMGENNTLYYPLSGAYLGAFRAYFELENSIGNAVLYFGDGETTGVMLTTDNGQRTTDGAWYMLDGRKLGNKPTVRGIYIHNGKKVVIK